ncbi:MAG TPA: peptide ABC transporter substrate-binding protein [Dehalococcoidia bacterium]|nr:peptide ABC transporter substrate-binding protein [Dehalococcoidia bacterium]
METRRLVLVLGGIAVVLVIVLGGLSIAVLGGGSGSGGGNKDKATPETSPLPERVEGELRLVGPDPLTLDPACASDASSAEYIMEIFSGLVTFDKDLKLVPDIAESLPQISDDGTVYTFHLRRGVKFHDGSRQVTADDFKFSMQRSLDPDTLSTVGEVYLDDIVGAKEFASGDTNDVSGIKVVDEYTLEITIDAAKTYFLAKLTYPTAFVVDQREVGDSSCFRDTEWTLKPNGSGPFMLEEWQLGQRIVLTANPAFYLEPKPSLARVTYVLAGGSPLVMYENDEIDITGVGINDIERIRDSSVPLNAEFTETASLDTYYIGFNTQEPPFDDPNVRRAFAMTIDKDVLAEVVLKELVVPAKGVLPPGMPGFSEDLEGIPFDPEGARALLDDAGGPGGLGDISLLSSGRGASVGPIIEAIQAMWEENLGVTVEVDQEEFGLFLQDLDDGNFKMFDLGWVADYVDPQNFLDIKFHSASANNETKYSNPEVDDLLERARTEQEAARLDLYRQAEEKIVEDAAWIPLYHGKSNALIKPYVEGYFTPPFVIPNLRYVSLTTR